MSGTGPFGAEPAGHFNFDPPTEGALYLEPTPKRIRVVLAGETIADSRTAMLLHETRHQPIYYFPPEDVRTGTLEPSDRHTRCPMKGEASYYTIRAGDRTIDPGAWYYPDPLAGAPPIRDLIAFYWNRMDRWLEEDEEVLVHPRDPYHRIDVLQTNRCVRVSLQGEVLAESNGALALFESNLPPRWYLPREDVRAELEPSETVTRCPYKGKAAYHSVQLPSDRVVSDLVWSYAEPFAEAARIKDRLCFLDEKVDLELDGEPQERPASPWQDGTGAREAQNAPPAQTRG